MGASQRPKDPDMDPEADDGGSVQPPDDPRSTESFTWLPRIKSISPFLDFKEESSLMPDCYSSSEVKVEADDVDSVQSPDDLRSTESFTWLPRIKSISPLVNFKEESSLMKRDEPNIESGMELPKASPKASPKAPPRDPPKYLWSIGAIVLGVLAALGFTLLRR